MLKINGLYKEKKNNVINAVDIAIPAGKCISLECSDDISNLLVDLILGREMQAKGEIYIENIKNTEYLRKNVGRIGVVRKEDALYENMTIESYMKFYAKILGTKIDYKEIMLKLAILDIGNMRIKNLNFSQRRRVSFARERLKQLKLLIFQEPILNMNRDGARIILENIDELCANGTAVMVTSVFFKNAVMVGEKAYSIDNDGIVEINNSEANRHKDEPNETNKTYKIEKIPAKVEDKLLLFDPVEIDYVESVQAISYLYIRGEKFPCSISLTDLEERLKYFGFFRCHRSYLVNLQRVREVITWTRNSYSLSLGDKVKSSVPLSKGRLDELKEILKL